MRHPVLTTSAAALLSTGCLVTDTVEYIPPAPGAVAVGSCMCATCWDRPFCFRPSDGSACARGAPGCATCPPGFEDSVPTAAVTAAGGRGPVFHCFFPGSDRLPPDSPATCWDDPVLRAAEEHVDPCVDVPLSCRTSAVDPTAFVGCTELPSPGDPACPPGTQVGPRRSACGERLASETDLVLARVRAQEKLGRVCAAHGVGVPDGAGPERYCFLSCLDPPPSATALRTCDPAIFDPPEVRPGSVVASLDPTRSFAWASVRGETARFGLQGEVAVTIPPECAGPLGPGETASCPAMIPLVDLQASEPFRLAGRRITDVVTINSEVATGTMLTLETAALVSVTEGGPYSVSGRIEGISGLRASDTTSVGAMAGAIDFTSREVWLLQGFEDTSAGTSLFVVVAASLPNLAPRAHAGGDQAVECEGGGGATVAFSAAASLDPDGSSDLAGFHWTVRTPDGSLGRHFAREATAFLPLGDTDLELRVEDRAGVASGDSARVEVRDTVGPDIRSVELVTDCLWPPRHDLYLFRLGREILVDAEDSCGQGPTLVRIVDVTSNQGADALGDGATEPDVVFGGGAACLREERSARGAGPRAYSIRVEARDVAGNRTARTVTVRVPHDERPSTRCDPPPLVRVDSLDDPRCVADRAERAALIVRGGAVVSDADGGVGSGPSTGGGACAAAGPTRPTGTLPGVASTAVLALLGRRRRRR